MVLLYFSITLSLILASSFFVSFQFHIFLLCLSSHAVAEIFVDLQTVIQVHSSLNKESKTFPVITEKIIKRLSFGKRCQIECSYIGSSSV